MNKENSIPRFRTVKQCIEIIRTIDPDTAITEWYIRQLVDSGAVISYGSGNKHLINLGSLLEYLNRGDGETCNNILEGKENE